jgi:hypothetical protein
MAFGVLVHLKGGAGMGTAAISTPFYVYTVSFDSALLEELPISSLPAGWKSEPPTAAGRLATLACLPTGTDFARWPCAESISILWRPTSPSCSTSNRDLH